MDATIVVIGTKHMLMATNASEILNFQNISNFIITVPPKQITYFEEPNMSGEYMYRLKQNKRHITMNIQLKDIQERLESILPGIPVKMLIKIPQDTQEVSYTVDEEAKTVLFDNKIINYTHILNYDKEYAKIVKKPIVKLVNTATKIPDCCILIGNLFIIEVIESNIYVYNKVKSEHDIDVLTCLCGTYSLQDKTMEHIGYIQRIYQNSSYYDTSLFDITDFDIKVLKIIKSLKTTSWFIRGDFNGWKLQALKLTNRNYILNATIRLNNVKNEFKIDSGMWLESYPLDGNKVLPAGSYHVYFNTLSKEIHAYETNKDRYEWYVRGTHNNWMCDEVMEKISDFEYSTIIEFNNIYSDNLFKIGCNDWTYSYPVENIRISNGIYVIYFNILTNEVKFKIYESKDLAREKEKCVELTLTNENKVLMNYFSNPAGIYNNIN